ncbi:lysophospholipid acyltransferase family protein [Sulfurimonas sp.]|uniref:lysophospholipid acyltransferase family protein n=1 Tax=Sulfurimonas sp. TaxID=2022749 RepID=UPI002629498A|nr:lysophospholipid acyltransferase family protein [Sulfurimonas sp.]
MLDIEKAYNKNFAKLNEKLPKGVNRFFIKMLQRLFHEKTFNDIHAKNHYKTNLDFVDSMVENLGIRYMVEPNELGNIPSIGRVLVIANHITGASDAFTLVQLIANARENRKVKLMVNGMLMGVKQAEGILIPVDNISGNITKKSFQAINTALQNEEAVVIFPAGIVSRLSWQGIKDLPWKASFLKIAKKNHTPILPIRIEARNSILFYLVSLILPMKFSGLMLPREFAISGTLPPLHYHIGKVIPPASFCDKKIQINEYVEMFYKHLYNLGTKKGELLQTQNTIIPTTSKMLLKAEVARAEQLGRTSDNKRIILADVEHTTSLIRELGRAREISFRAIGGGTGKTKDNDLYDDYYKHLILWDDEDLEIVGAYRIGETQDIVKHRGMQGLYTYNFSTYDKNFQNYIDKSVELGRSFILPKYWGSRALDNLWQGVGAYLAKHHNIIYTYGTVTINADTPKKAVAALVYFYSRYFSSQEKIMTAKTPYIMSEKYKTEFDALFHAPTYKENFIILKQYLKSLNTAIPTLFKQYTELYEEGAVRFLDFSVNDALHGVVEGFIMADNSKMKESKRKRYIKKYLTNLPQ